MSILDGISSPADVRALSEAQLPGLISEVRRRIIDVTLKNGGHLASMAAQWRASCAVRSLALPSEFVRQGTPEQQRSRYGLTPEGILELYEREKDEITA